MKRLYFVLSLIFVVSAALTACSSGTPTSSWPTPEGSKLDTNYSGAIPSFLVLALGTIKLDGAVDAITPEQAQKLLPLWQVLRSSINTGGTDQAEVDALVLKIEGVLTESQIAAINALKLTQGDIRNWAVTNGVAQGAPSPEMQATQQAMAQSGQIGKSGVALLGAIVTYLEAKQ